MKFESLPSIDDLQKISIKRIPMFARAFLESGTGDNICVRRNRSIYENHILHPAYLHDRSLPNSKTAFLNQTYSQPFGIAPIGMAGLIWPNSDRFMAHTAHCYDHPYCMSSISSLLIEEASVIAGKNFWFQLYPTASKDIQSDIINRCKESSVETLVVTIDVPTHARRPELLRAGLGMPMRLNRRIILQAIQHPRWLLSICRYGIPKPVNLLRYIKAENSYHVSEQELYSFLSDQFGNPLSLKDIIEIRQMWTGKLIVKGILGLKDAKRAISAGADAIWVSNHGGRQLDMAPHPLETLTNIRSILGEQIPIIIDSGIRSGGDIATCLARGANFTFLGRPFAYGAVLGEQGTDHVSTLLGKELTNILTQLGCNDLADLEKNIE